MTNAYSFLSDFINNGRYEECALRSHTRWLNTKFSQGWTYGEKRDPEAKKNPMLRPFDELPADAQSLNRLVPYTVANFFRTAVKESSLGELDELFEDILDGKREEMLEQLGEYVHSHFIIRLLAEGETTKTRRDMVVFQDLDEETKSWDIQISLEVIEFLREDIRASIGD
ncbi:MAG: hypothetical protein HYZ26_07885 [Chloroflexi bacterium]|nr:hypothetical protein [Chloroflexota bacterium]